MDGARIIGDMRKGIRLKQFLKCILFLSCLIAIARAQSENLPADLSDSLNNAIALYENHQYIDAHREFATLAKNYPDDKRSSVCHYMAAKSLYSAGNYDMALLLFSDFISSFPGSSFMAETRLFKGHSLYRIGDVQGAAGEYLLSVDLDPKSEAARVARDNLMPLVHKGLNIDELEQLITDNPGSSLAEVMEFTLAKREIEAGQYRKGIRALKTFLKRRSGSRDYKQARGLLEKAIEKSEAEIAIGLLAPVTGGFHEYGRSMIEGAKLALKGIGSDSPGVELLIRDTAGDPIKAIRTADALSEEEPLAVVGPLRSESSISAAVVFNERGIPMITPTASETGVSSIGPYVFQVTPSAERIGQMLAQYAVRNLGIKEFGIISPDDVGGTRISNAFAEAVYEYGGEVIYTAYYVPGSTDFKQQIMPLKEILLAETKEMLASGKLDSIAFRDPKKDELLPEEDWPVELGGLFLPGYVDDLKLLIPQVRYHVIHTPFLGSESWDSPELLREVKRYIGDAVFATDFHVDPDEGKWSAFVDAYSSAYNRPPDKVAALTYDAVKLVLKGIDDGYRNCDDLRWYLNSVEGYDGVAGEITFRGTGRANNNVAVYSIDGKRLAGSE